MENAGGSVIEFFFFFFKGGWEDRKRIREMKRVFCCFFLEGGTILLEGFVRSFR